MLFEACISSILNITLLNQSKRPSDQILYISSPSYRPQLINRSNLPACNSGFTRLLVVSDTHEVHYELDLPESDVFIHCGDILITNRHFSVATSIVKLNRFNHWLASIKSNHRIVIGGNHDDILEKLGKSKVQSIFTNATYLEHDHLQIEKMSFWGSPYSEGKSKNKAFQSDKVKSVFESNAPSEVDILLTHGECSDLKRNIHHKLHIWGHSHNSYGVTSHKHDSERYSLSICAATMDFAFNLSHPPIVIDVPRNMKTAKIPKVEPFTLSTKDPMNMSNKKILSIWTFPKIYPSQ